MCHTSPLSLVCLYLLLAGCAHNATASSGVSSMPVPPTESTEIGVRRLIDRYHAAVNLQDWALLRQLFTADSVWQAAAPLDMRFEGREAIVAGLRQSVARQDLLVQTSAALVIEPQGDDMADVTSTLIEFGREAETGRGWSAVAFYRDRVVRTGSDWQFEKRMLYLRYEDDAPIGSGIHPLPMAE
jgi:hypothetical protein